MMNGSAFMPLPAVSVGERQIEHRARGGAENAEKNLSLLRVLRASARSSV